MLLLFYNRYQITRSQLCFLFLFLGFLSSDLTLLPEDKDSYLRFGASFFRILLLGFGEIQGKRKNVDSAFVLFSLLSCPCVSVEPKQIGNDYQKESPISYLMTQSRKLLSSAF
nr:uncharacterized protein LOC112493584 isoform X4 [Ziziphus jujuba var. spinosa]